MRGRGCLEKGELSRRDGRGRRRGVLLCDSSQTNARLVYSRRVAELDGEMALGVEAGQAFVDLMRRYVVEYTNRHDQSVTADLMEPDYVLRMGEHMVRGRDGLYRSATAKQLEQFPGLVLTVHEIATSGERLVMRFSEHGASRRHGGLQCCWNGIGLYAWNGTRLIRNCVEQDYFSRKMQLERGFAQAVSPPATAPWDTVAEAPDADAEETVRAWLQAGGLTSPADVRLDDCEPGKAAPLLDQSSIEFNEFFSCGRTVAFHVTQHGRFVRDGGIEGKPGSPVFLHVAGCVHVVNGEITGHAIRNRLELQRRFNRSSWSRLDSHDPG